MNAQTDTHIHTTIFKKLKDLILEEYPKGTRFYSVWGGSRAGKTDAILNFILEFQLSIYAKEKAGKIPIRPYLFSIVTDEYKNLEQGVMNDWNKILQRRGLQGVHDVNLSKRTYKLSNFVIQFFAIDKAEKALGGTRDFLFINEASRFASEQGKQIVSQLIMRTQGFTIIDFNPTKEFWAMDDSIANFKKLHATYKDNEFCPPSAKEFLESEKFKYVTTPSGQFKLDDKGERIISNKYRIYTLGEVGIAENLVFDNWDYFDRNNIVRVKEGVAYTKKETDINISQMQERWAVDFGYLDPSVILRLYTDHKRKLIYVIEEFYKSGATLQDIAQKLTELEGNPNYIVCDNHLQSINSVRAEMLRLGSDRVGRVQAVKKTKKFEMVQIVKEYGILIDSRSPNLAREIKELQYIDLPNGEKDVQDGNDHTTDAFIYGAKTEIAYYNNTGRAKATN